jgi:hypothetical protein
MKLSTFIFILQRLSPDLEVSICGSDQFYLYGFGKKRKDFSELVIDHTEIDLDNDLPKGFDMNLILDSATITSDYERSVVDRDDEIKMHKIILKALDSKGGK